MKKPEWLKRLEEAIADRKTVWNDDTAQRLSNHLDNNDIHRTIHISNVSPSNADGKDGDIHITIEE